ncbi:MAG: MurR/RpiR family transcriptional regulator [Pseudomonadota bacterium]
MSQLTIAERLKEKKDSLTRSERQLADVILKNYPASGLGTITSLGEAAEVSTPTVARLVQKLEFSGFPEFQAALREELNEKISGPITKRDVWANNAPDAHIMNKFTDEVIGNIKQTLGEIDTETFDRACSLISDLERAVYVVGGRITRTLADHFFLHAQVLRKRVTHINSNSNAWPHYMLDVKKGDVVVVFDIRRYENSTLRLAEFAKEKEAEIILFTDQWQSPVAGFASVTFSNRIAVPSAWDSLVTCILLSEIIIAEVQERHWGTTRGRMEELENMFDRTRFFRKF